MCCMRKEYIHVNGRLSFVGVTRSHIGNGVVHLFSSEMSQDYKKEK